MKKLDIYVTVEFRDDTRRVYKCVDNPGVGDWVTLYLPNVEREMIPKDAVQRINIKIR